MTRLVIGVDGSDHARAALDWAIRMAKGMNIEVVAVFAIVPPVYFDTGIGVPPSMPVQFDEQWRKDLAHEFDEEWCKPLREAGVPYRAVIEDGRAATVLLNVAERENADIVVVGRRGRGGFASLLLGSVSNEIVLQSKRPVLVISGPPAS